MTEIDPSRKPLLSICMIVKNEEQSLGRALASADGLDAELVVVDTGSTDRTVEIAAEAKAKIVHFAWIDDFSAARNHAFQHALGRWMVVLDADEELTEDFRHRAPAILGASQAGGIRIPVSNVDERGVLRMKASSIRIVRNGHGYAYEGRVHEEVATSITRAGGTIEDADLPLVHHGYTSSEDARKQRHERNMRLVSQAHEAAPHDPRHWHYLALQYAIIGDYEKAAPLFERVIDEHPSHELAGWSASQLASIRIGERAFGAAWHAAMVGSRAKLGRATCLLKLGEIALRDGDPLAALTYAAELEKLPPRVEGDSERRRESTIVLRARATAANGRAREGYALLVKAAKAHPDDAGIADDLVKMAEKIDPKGRANVTAAKDARGSAAVIAAGIGTFVRRRAWAQAVLLGDTHGVRNEYYAHALLRVGRADEAREIFTSFGPSAAVHLLIASLESETPTASDMEKALAWLPQKASVAVEHVVSARKVPRQLAWCILEWMELAIAFRAEAVAERLSRCLPGTDTEGAASYALLRYEGGEPMEALRLALTCPDEPDALEVIGLVAHDHGDTEASSVMLTRRARAGDVSVRVALRGATALRAKGKKAAAEEILELGRSSRPQSIALRR